MIHLGAYDFDLEVRNIPVDVENKMMKEMKKSLFNMARIKTGRKMNTLSIEWKIGTKTIRETITG